MILVEFRGLFIPLENRQIKSIPDSFLSSILVPIKRHNPFATALSQKP